MKSSSHLQALLLSSLLPLSVVPSISHADSSNAAMEACVKAFVTTSIGKDRPISVKMDDRVPSPFNTRARAYKIQLTATGKDSGKKLASATCITNSKGVLELNGKPVTPELVATNEG